MLRGLSIWVHPEVPPGDQDKKNYNDIYTDPGYNNMYDINIISCTTRICASHLEVQVDCTVRGVQLEG